MKKRRIRVGERVAFKMGVRTVTATVIADRGDIGVGGRQLLRIRMDAEGPEEPAVFEMPAEDVAVV